MKNFFGNVLATVVGLFVFTFLVTLFSFLIVLIAASSGGDDFEVQENSIMTISLDYAIPEKSPADPLQGLDFFNMSINQSMGLTEILTAIDAAAEDDRIEGIYLKTSNTPNGIATLKAIRDRLESFQESGKFIVAYSELYSQKSYYMVSVADEIYLNPKGMMDFRGLGAQMVFFKGMMEKVGVKIIPFHAGQYKSAFEPFTREKMSDANREAYKFILDEIYAQFLESIGDSRDMSSTELHNIANGLLLENSQSAVDLGMIDGLKYQDEVMELLKDKTGRGEDDDINWISTSKYFRYEAGETDSESDNVAVLFAMGNIVDGDAEEGTIGSENYAKMIRDIREDESIAALVLRVNSGGGSALASEVILRELNLAKETMPVIVSFGDVAASGGYYISCHADHIFAEPNTITGSIGVFGLIPDMSEMFNDKLGITFDTVSTAQYAVFSGGTGALKDREAEVIQNGIDEIYMDFLTHVYEGRKDKGLLVGDTALADLVAGMAHVAEGRVWTGTQALDLGLVDDLGNLDAAVAYAAEEASISKYGVVKYPKREDLDFFGEIIMEIVEEEQKDSEARVISEVLGVDMEYLWMLKDVRTMYRYQMRMPVVMEIF